MTARELGGESGAQERTFCDAITENVAAGLRERRERVQNKLSLEPEPDLVNYSGERRPSLKGTPGS